MLKDLIEMLRENPADTIKELIFTVFFVVALTILMFVFLLVH